MAHGKVIGHSILGGVDVTGGDTHQERDVRLRLDAALTELRAQQSLVEACGELRATSVTVLLSNSLRQLARLENHARGIVQQMSELTTRLYRARSFASAKLSNGSPNPERS